mmetsp:Transcript_57360/g.131646  ORF Transcript_57360/g.131646 Transcript_57360/m.131646 type:complete len:224 (+) Transcript_57360:138-809(+)
MAQSAAPGTADSSDPAYTGSGGQQRPPAHTRFNTSTQHASLLRRRPLRIGTVDIRALTRRAWHVRLRVWKQRGDGGAHERRALHSGRAVEAVDRSLAVFLRELDDFLLRRSDREALLVPIRRKPKRRPEGRAAARRSAQLLDLLRQKQVVGDVDRVRRVLAGGVVRRDAKQPAVLVSEAERGLHPLWLWQCPVSVLDRREVDDAIETRRSGPALVRARPECLQ